MYAKVYGRSIFQSRTMWNLRRRIIECCRRSIVSSVCGESVLERRWTVHALSRWILFGFCTCLLRVSRFSYADPLPISQGSTTCSPTCPAGKIPNGSGNTCDDCPAGQYSAAGDTTCSTCPANTFSAASASSCSTCGYNSGSSPGSGSCAPICLSGSYVDANGGCGTCQAGTHSTDPVSGSCDGCSAGTFAAEGSGTCTSCPNDTFSGNNAGSCTACAPGSGNSGVCSFCLFKYF